MAQYDDLNPLITYNGSGWSDSKSFSTNRIGTSTKIHTSPSEDNTIVFYFTGTYLKTYGAGYSGMHTFNKITIDDVEYNMNAWSSITNNQIGVSFDKSDLSVGVHKAVISHNSSARIYLDGVECAELVSEDVYNGVINDGGNVSQKYANLNYTIPMNTTSNIKAKTNDSRTGLLGMANDPENFGDLYVVGRDGKAHLTKSGVKSEVLFEGVANAMGQYNLVDSIDKYSYLLIMAKITHSNSDFDDSTSDIIYKSEFENMKYKCISSYFSDDSYYAIEYKLTDSILDIYTIKNGTSSMWTTPHIYQIIGIY